MNEILVAMVSQFRSEVLWTKEQSNNRRYLAKWGDNKTQLSHGDYASHDVFIRFVAAIWAPSFRLRPFVRARATCETPIKASPKIAPPYRRPYFTAFRLLFSIMRFSAMSHFYPAPTLNHRLGHALWRYNPFASSSYKPLTFLITPDTPRIILTPHHKRQLQRSSITTVINAATDRKW